MNVVVFVLITAVSSCDVVCKQETTKQYLQ